jgi:hypothetical protein
MNDSINRWFSACVKGTCFMGLFVGGMRSGASAADAPQGAAQRKEELPEPGMRELILHLGIHNHQARATSSADDEFLCVLVAYPKDDMGGDPLFAIKVPSFRRHSPNAVATLMMSPILDEAGSQPSTHLSIQVRGIDGKYLGSARKAVPNRIYLRGTLAPRLFPKFNAADSFLKLEIWDDASGDEPIEAVGVLCTDGKRASEMASALLLRNRKPAAPQPKVPSDKK